MSHTLIEPEVVQHGTRAARWMTIIYNNEENTFEEVVSVLVRSTHCDVEEASIETWEAHTYGKAAVHFSDRLECEAVAKTISSIGVKTEVKPEWDD